MSKKIFFYPLFLLFFLWITSCSDLNVKPNLPDEGNVLGTPGQLLEASATLYRDWFNAAHALKGPALGLATASDQITSTHGDAAAVDLAKEPRESFLNTTDYSFAYVTKNFWGKTYQVVLLANDILRNMEDKETILYEGQDIKPMLTAWCYFIRGIGYGYLGLIFDQAPLVDIHTSLPYNKYSDYHDVIRFALTSLDSAIAISHKHTFTLPDSLINGVVISSGKLAGIANSYAARIDLSFPRNMAENQQADWQGIYDYASQGITQDLSPAMDNDQWKDEYRQYAASTYWGRIDLRVIHRLDQDFPAHWPADNAWDTPNGQAPDSSFLSSPDKRAVTDIIWDPPTVVSPPIYLNSFYRCKRYDDWMVSSTGPVPEFTLTENNLILAESLVHLGHKADAMVLLNGGTRTQRGHLPPLDAMTPDNEVLKAVFYERDMELMITGLGISFFDMRRRDLLQKGTPLHFPVPASELQIVGLPSYTYGGVDHADGVNTSNGGWF